MIAIGLGCRKNCSGTEIAALVRGALAQMDARSEAGLFTVLDKQNESGLHEAAAMLDMPLTFLPRAALAAQMENVQTKSAKAERIYGLASISEAAALAGADCATIPPAVFTDLFKHPLTDKGLEQFLADWAKTGQSIL